VRAILVTLVALAGGCTGEIGAPTHRTGAGGGGATAEFAPAPPSLHRLTTSQYGNTLVDLFGPDLVLPTDLEVDTPLHGFNSIGAGELTIPPRAAEQYEDAALSVAGQVMRDEARRAALVGCETAVATDPCVAGFLARFGRRAWRRPLEADEIASLQALAASVTETFGGDAWKGLEYVIAALLQSPDFLFRVEVGEPDPQDATRRRYDSWEMAARLSYLLWDSTPDDELLDAAERDELVAEDGLRTQVLRMLALPRARMALVSFWGEYLSLSRLEGLDRDPAQFPQMTPTLPGAMRGEIEHLFTDVVFDRDADFRDIFSTRTTFVDSELADLYGLPDPAVLGYTRVELPEDSPRGGLVATAGILAMYAHHTVTSPTNRGKFVRVNLLCQDISPPPPGVNTNLPESEGGPRTMREKLEMHRTNPTCAGCHSLMDPIGLSLEHFDSIGAWRDTDQGLPLDTTAEIDGVTFDGARELGEVLRAHPGAGACVARRLYRHGTGHLEVETEQPQIAELAAQFADSGFRFQDLVLALVLSPGFRTAAEPE